MIQKQFGVKYHSAHMSRLLKRIKYSQQKPVEKASQRNEEAIAAWKESHWPEVKKKALQEGAPLSSSMKPDFICSPCA